ESAPRREDCDRSGPEQSRLRCRLRDAARGRIDQRQLLLPPVCAFDPAEGVRRVQRATPGRTLPEADRTLGGRRRWWGDEIPGGARTDARPPCSAHDPERLLSTAEGCPTVD